jgi:hypothetical protein
LQKIYSFDEAMDHLLQDRDKFIQSSTPKTSWLGFDHDSLPPMSFRDYPVKRGWDVSQLLSGNLQEAHQSLHSETPERAARLSSALLQSWLYFGLLEGVFETRIPIANFIRTDPEGLVLHSEPLTRWKPLVVLMLHVPKTIRESDGNMDRTIREAQTVYSQVIRFTHRPSKAYPTLSALLESILHSIMLMIEIVQGLGRALGIDYPLLSFPP